MKTVTAPRIAALRVLDGRGWVRGSKRSSSARPTPYVNLRAADGLVKEKLAEGRDRAFHSQAVRSAPSSRWVSTMEYRITPAGEVKLREIDG